MSGYRQTAPMASEGAILLNAYQEPRHVPLYEQGVLTLWFIVTYITIPFATPIRYLLVGVFVIYAFMQYRAVWPLLLRSWPLMLLPILGAFSFLWSDYSSMAMRQGVLYLLTPLLAIVMAARFELRILLRCFFFASAFAALWSLQFAEWYTGGGPYASKNYLGLHMTFALFFAIIRAFDQKELMWLRLSAIPIIALTFWIMLQANSATSLVFSVIGSLGLLLVRFVWMNIGRMRHLRTVIMLSSATAALAVVMVILSMQSNTLVADFLDMLGKDATLTGRADIWRAGELVASERPILGVGLEGFWQYDVGAAQTINENDHKPFGTKLTFHNAYLEVRVHLGYVGYALFLLLVAWCLFQIVGEWLRRPTLECSAMLVIGMIIFVSTFTESWLWLPLNAITNLFYFGAITPLSKERRQFVGQIPARLSNAATAA